MHDLPASCVSFLSSNCAAIESICILVVICTIDFYTHYYVLQKVSCKYLCTHIECLISSLTSEPKTTFSLFRLDSLTLESFVQLFSTLALDSLLLFHAIMHGLLCPENYNHQNKQKQSTKVHPNRRFL